MHRITWGRPMHRIGRLFSSRKDVTTMMQNAASCARTPPQHIYTQSNIFDYEIQAVFLDSGTWICVGSSHQFKLPGQYVASCFAQKHPYVVLRDQKQQLKAYFNVCRHHAAALVGDGEGTLEDVRTLECPYHGWQYNTEDGRLTKAIKIKNIQQFKAKEFGLVSLPVREVGPLVFLNLAGADVEIRNLDQDIQPLTDALETSGWTSDQYRHVYSRDYVIDCNWKVFVENYLDGGYHISYLHEGLASNLGPDTYKTTCYDRVSLQTCLPLYRTSSTRI